MNILYLTLANIEDVNARGLTLDLVNQLAITERLYVVCSRQKRMNLSTELSTYKNMSVLKVKTGNITKTKSLFEKAISLYNIERQYKNAINSFYGNIKFDLIIYSTPPITFNRLIKSVKRKNLSGTYLILKDIFPQNAVDLNLIKKKGLIHRYYRSKERKLYQISDYIGCMSNANVNYLMKHNKNIDEERVEVFPNSINPINKSFVDVITKRQLLEKCGLPTNKCNFVFGGNFGRPQGIKFLLEVMRQFHEVEGASLVLIGNGTEFKRIKLFSRENKFRNVYVIDRMPKSDYDTFMHTADVGLVLLDYRFTIPNYPSRITSYMENGIPILAATDVNTDVKELIEENHLGYWCESKDAKLFIEKAKNLSHNIELRRSMGLNCRTYLENNFDVKKNIGIILNHFKGE
jgi:glycosyltransferase involved in cell wall biosynthesis